MTLYVSDLDGTLLNNDAQVSEISKKLLNKVLNNNTNFTIATARTPATISQLLDGIDIKLPVISMNGSTIYDLKKEEYIYYNKLPTSIVSKLNKIINSETVQAFIYTIKDNYLTVYHNKLVNPYEISFYNQRSDRKKYKNFIESPLPPNSEVLFFAIIDSEDKLNKLYEKIKDIPNISIAKYRDAYNYEIFYLEIYDINSTKSNAIKYLKHEYNFNEVISFGDNLNDISMFNISDACYAVNNAVHELKEISTGVIGSNIEDSVSKFIYYKSLFL